MEKARQLKRGVKADMVADILMNLYLGLQVGARSGKGPRQLSDLTDFTLRSIKK